MAAKSNYTFENVVKENAGKMDYVRLGDSGLRVSKVCLGMMSYGDKRWQDWVLEEEESLPIIKAAYDAGVNFWDTANIYSNGVSEIITGKAIKKYNLPRENLVIATKVFATLSRDWEQLNPLTLLEKDRKGYLNQGGLSRKHILDSVNQSLKRLDLEYIDLLQIHRFDPNTPIKETMKALHDVVESGKVRYIGASSMFGYQFMEMQMTARQYGWTEFITMQNFYCAAYREEEREIMPACTRLGVASIPWSPLGGGFLARPVDGQGTSSRADTAPKRYGDEGSKAVNKAIQTIAEKRGVNMAQVALAWTFACPAVKSPIVGISNARALDDALKGIHIELTKEEIDAINKPYVAREITGHS